MLYRMEYTCKYACDITGYRADKPDQAVEHKVIKSTVLCTSMKVLTGLLEKWNRQGGWTYSYYMTSINYLANMRKPGRNYKIVDSVIQGMPAYTSVEKLIYIKFR